MGNSVEGLPAIQIKAVHPVVDDGEHNAFTDLARFRGRYYLCFRSCPEGHMLFTTSRIRVLVSDDGITGWTQVCEFGVPHRDVRDPHLLVFNGKLFVYSGTWLVAEDDRPRDCNDHLGFGAWTEDGDSWHGPRMLEGTYGHYVWHAAAHGGTAYLCGRRRRGFAPLPADGEDRRLLEGAMLASDDGLTWRTAGLFTEDYGNETAFHFDEQGTVWALARGAEGVPARICRAAAPYTDWERVNLDQDVGGPLLVQWGGGRWLVGGRRMTDPENPRTVLWFAAPSGDSQTGAAAWTLHEAAELPSGGDNSYPGFVALDDERGLLSFYSSHEGSGRSVAPCHVYIAEISIS
ncbi:MAG: hypothetical protein QGI32_07480 [Candidatus Latescibacteria bacterium]|jgi:hypothetical protein|nr:hypothetical protein [Candidatus Latescibacterota bacterium]